MSSTLEENKATQKEFMDRWSGGEIESEYQLKQLQDHIRSVLMEIRAAEKPVDKQIKQWRGMIADAEMRLEDLTRPLWEVIKVGDRLIGYWQEKQRAESDTGTDQSSSEKTVIADPVEAAIDAVIEALEKPKPKKKKGGK